MRTLAVIGTAGGAGVSTVAALAYSLTRVDWQGGSLLLGRDGARLLPVSGNSVPVVDPRIAGWDGPAALSVIWDAGVHTAPGAVDLLRSAGVTVVLVSPATPLGSADARRFLDRVVSLDETLLPRLALVQNGVYGRHRGGRASDVTASVVLQWPYDRALARAGGAPVDPHTLSRRSRRAATALQRYCVFALRRPPAARPPVVGGWTPT
jgi:hypothetical protein